MKKSIIFSLIIFSTMFSYGQLSIGVSAGSNLSTMTVFRRDLSTFKINPIFGINANLIADYMFNPNMSLWTGLSISQKGFNQHIKYYFRPGLDSTAEITSKLTYIELPIYLKFNTSIKQINIFYGAGPYVAYGIQGKVTTNITGRDNITIEDKIKWNKSYDYKSDLLNTYGYSNIKRLDFGIGTILGFSYKNFMLTASYQYGLNNLMWEYFQDEKMSNSSLSISFGYFISNILKPKQL